MVLCNVIHFFIFSFFSNQNPFPLHPFLLLHRSIDLLALITSSFTRFRFLRPPFLVLSLLLFLVIMKNRTRNFTCSPRFTWFLLSFLAHSFLIRSLFFYYVVSLCCCCFSKRNCHYGGTLVSRCMLYRCRLVSFWLLLCPVAIYIDYIPCGFRLVATVVWCYRVMFQRYYFPFFSSVG